MTAMTDEAKALVARLRNDYGEWFAPHPDILAEIERLATPGGPNND